MASLSAWNNKHPVWSILLVAILAVGINCYPIIFSGKSYVSPIVTENKLVYGWWPSLPGMPPMPAQTSENNVPLRTLAGFHNTHGSDTGAAMWWGVPISFLEWRSLWEHGEIPLWNRYGHAGDTLIGQAVSMLGDPLQLIVLLGHGSAGAWDVKFLLAKFLFCAGFGLLLLRLLKSPPLALIFTALAAYCGAFFYINNHLVFFVFSYAPWILLTACEWLNRHSRRRGLWGLAWLLANFACFNAGHVEPAVVLIAGLNLAALVLALSRQRRLSESIKVLGSLAVGTLLFLGLTAPVWLSFLAALDGSYSIHDKIQVRQLPVADLPGAFDDVFYLLSRPDNSLAALAPGTSLLIWTGCLFSWWRWRSQKDEPFFWINTAAVLLWGGCVFGWIPAPLLAVVPLLNRVGHIYTDFSYLLVIHLTIQSAYGFKALAQEHHLRRVLPPFAGMIGLGGAGLLLYCLGTRHQPLPWLYLGCASAGAIGAPLLFAVLNCRRRLNLASGWLTILLLGFLPNARFAFYNFGNDALVTIPGPREVLNSPSPAVTKIKADQTGPFRVVGMQWCFAGDYSAVYELEDIRSCAPLSNGEFINLVRQSPGVEFSRDWMINITNLALAQPLLNLLNVKYLLSWPDVSLRQPLAFRITDRSDFGVLENLQVWPRAFFANHVIASSSTAEFSQQLAGKSRQPFIVLTPAEIASQPGLQSLATSNPAAISPATHYQLLPNATEFDVHAAAAGVVCLTEGQAKDFTATANDQPKTVLTVNRAFKGIYLDQPGDYHVRFTFRPRHWRLACSLFWLALASAILLAFSSHLCLNVTKPKPPSSAN